MTSLAFRTSPPGSVPRLSSVLRSVHMAEFYHARERLVFEEFLVFVLALRRTRERNERAENGFVIKRRSEIDRFLANLPYELTGDLQRCGFSLILIR